MLNLSERIQKLEAEIATAAKKSGRRAQDITLIAVSKTYEAEHIRAAIKCGLTNFGENYVQEALPKIHDITGELKEKDLAAIDASSSGPAIHWHFVGHLQSNKVKSIVGKFAMIHSIDSFGTAEELSKRVDQDPDVSEPQKILIEVNLGEEATKTGILLNELHPLLDKIQDLPYVQICGLMAMPPLDWEPDQLRRAYNHFRDERDRLASQITAPHSLVELSMGTSHDFSEAIQAGATMVRIGTRIFGERK